MAEIKMVWNGNTKGNGKIQGENLTTDIAIPQSLGGSGEGADPKELLIASAATCYATTLVYMLETKELPVTDFTMDSEVNVSKEDGIKIIHQPHIVLSSEATEKQREAVDRAFMSADKSCAVGNMLKKADAQITIEGKVTVK
ncbi:osmotically inducible protein OsmC [Gracilibacillus oryzae]|uniref:Osmotically inducible protein OsmC n=1 Tax=Gracilibacillus oryzae TaxID=1672701 RepID=A0A7C8KNT4_9BACI|nr:OsmC family protein [Gracilibacillus oryzae]KAB8128994.1 osmotically inducible protein OsmC [Gracilibacillus oryzae]